MLTISNHSPFVNSSNTTDPSKPRAAALVRETRIAMRSVLPQTLALASQLNAEGLQSIDAHFPGSMTFIDAQTAYWKTHTRPKVSTKMQNLVMLKTIAHDQEKAGLHFQGRRSATEVDLMYETLTQTSQAAQQKSFLSSIVNSAKALANDFYYYLEGNPSITDTVDEFSRPIEGSRFIVRKSKSLIKKETAGESISNYGIGLVDSSHGSIDIQNGIKAFLKKHFNAERGDIFLTEVVSIFEYDNGEEKVIRPSLEQHHTHICYDIPIQSCRFLAEPEKESAILIDAIASRRKLVNRVFEFFMNAIPTSKAYEARQKLKNRNKEIHTVDTSFKLKLLAEYQEYCPPEKEARFQVRIESLKEALIKQNAVEAATHAARNAIYFSQISNALKELKPGARLYYSIGDTHFVALDAKLNEIDGFFVDIVNPKVKDEL